MKIVLLALFAILSLPKAFADDTPIPERVVYAHCPCHIQNTDGVLMERRPSSEIPSMTQEPFSVTGQGVIVTEMAKNRCDVDETGYLLPACDLAKAKALLNADFLCGEKARTYNAEKIRGFQMGRADTHRCFYALKAQ